MDFAFPFENEQEIKEYLLKLKKEYYDAHHHCYAWMLGASANKSRTYDDGEPNHSAGNPILGQVRSKNLTNVLVVVVRYFRGTKLGVGGLISAYRSAAELALQTAKVIEVKVVKSIEISFNYEHTNEVMKLVKELDLKIVKQEFEQHCKIEVLVSISNVELLSKKIDLLTAFGIPLVTNEHNIS